jgi:hypothetical protein
MDNLNLPNVANENEQEILPHSCIHFIVIFTKIKMEAVKGNGCILN